MSGLLSLNDHQNTPWGLQFAGVISRNRTRINRPA